MRAAVCERLSDDLSGLVVRDLPAPEPGPGEVRVRLRAAAVNFPDILMTQGLYQLKPALPFTPGMEAAGEVEAVGEGVSAPAVGDAVVVGARFGCFAEQIVVPTAACRAVPPGMDLAQAAAFPVAAITAYVGLVVRGGLQAGETLLVHGASGGVGLAAVQLGKHLGATVIATSASPEKLALVMAQGADHGLPASGFKYAVKDLTGGRGADVIYDPVGGDVFDESVRCIAFDGRLLVIGFAGGRIPTVSANMPLIKGFSVVGVRAGEYGRVFPERGRDNQAAIDRLAAAGVFRARIHARYPLDRVHEAMGELSGRRVVGKVVVEL